MTIQNNFLFQERKAAQAAAFFIFKAGGSLEVLKLMKLMYLAERDSLERFGESITGDAFVSMPHGPVLSITLDHINHFVPSQYGGWSSWISDKADNRVGLQDSSMLRDENDLQALSEADLQSLQVIWQQYGHYSAWDLREMTHNGLCPEWSDPHGSSRPIPMLKLLKILGYSEEASLGLIRRMQSQAETNRLFSSIHTYGV